MENGGQERVLGMDQNTKYANMKMSQWDQLF
jgi:hypothetical protein